MNVFKNDNWPGDYSLCSYLSMSASLLTDCCLVSQKKCKVWQDGICLLNINDFLKRLSL